MFAVGGCGGVRLAPALEEQPGWGHGELRRGFGGNAKSFILQLRTKPPASGHRFPAKLWRVSAQRCTKVSILPVPCPCSCWNPFLPPGAGAADPADWLLCSPPKLGCGAGSPPESVREGGRGQCCLGDLRVSRVVAGEWRHGQA